MNFLARFPFSLLVFLTLCGLHPCGGSTPPPVPTIFLDLYNTMNADVGAFAGTINSNWHGSKTPVIFTADMTSANANSGSGIVGPNHYASVLLEIDALKAMGAKAVMVQIGFPMLYEPFFPSSSDYQLYANFYSQLASDVRARGMKLVVESVCLISQGVWNTWNIGSFYSGLNWTQYQQGRMQTAQTIVQLMHPDYLVVIEEPDSEAMFSGQTDAGTPSGSTALLGVILQGLQQNGLGSTQIGAGVGSWLHNYQQFIQSYVANTGVNFIDMHIYPANKTFLPNALAIAGMATAGGKKIGMSEVWLHKIRDNELGVLGPNDINARDSFSFWIPLDQYFLQTIIDFSYYENMVFISPTNTQALSGYLTYDSSTENLPSATIITDENNLSSLNLQQAIFSDTGLSYYSWIVSPHDSVPPSEPTGLTGATGNPNSLTLNWTGSTDNIGVAGYYVLRDGVKVGTTAQTRFQDTGLAGSTTYTYMAEAFDLAGNVSPPSLPISVTTKDVTPPTIPANLTAVAVATQKIQLTWSPSTDDTFVAYYHVFRGSSAQSLSQVANTSGVTFTDYSLTPATKYYYGVEAVDGSGNVSPMSHVAHATTLALPSAPAALVATPLSSKQIGLTWTAGLSGLPILAYQIYRGTSASSLSAVATTHTTLFTDGQLNPGTKYYFAVQETDTSGNVSPLSAVKAATTLP